MRHRPTKKQRKETLAVARAQLALQLQDSGAEPSLLAHAMQWNLAKTKEALRHMDSIGSLPYHFTKHYITWNASDEFGRGPTYSIGVDMAGSQPSLVDMVLEEKIAKLADAIAKDMAAASLDK